MSFKDESPELDRRKLSGGLGRTLLQARRPSQESLEQRMPFEKDCAVSTYCLRVKVDSFLLNDPKESAGKPLTHTVGVWGRTGNCWLVNPMSCKVDDATTQSTDIVKLVINAGNLNDAELILRLSTKKLISSHDIGSVTIPLNSISNGDSGPDLLEITELLTKQGSKNNPGNRGTIKLLLGVRPLTYILNGPVIMQRLPHQISFWVIAFVKPDDTKVMQGGIKSNLDRFRDFAVSVQDQDAQMRTDEVFCFGEMPCTAAALGRDGTRVALGISDTSEFGDGYVIVSVGSQKLTLTMREQFENGVAQFTKPFRDPSNAQSMWKKAVEAMKQLNPSTVVDLFGEGDSSDLDRMSVISRLIAEVSDVLSTGSASERADALKTLAIDAPQALCLAALNISNDALLRELEGVVYEEDLGVPAPLSDISVEGFLRKRMDSANPGFCVLSPLDVNNGGSAAWAAAGASPQLSPDGRSTGMWSAASPKVGSKMAPGGEASAKERFMSFLRMSPSQPKEGNSPKTTGALSLTPPSPGGLGSGSSRSPSKKKFLDVPEVGFDETWHGTRVSREDAASMEVSDVPRFGTLRPKSHSLKEIPKNIRAVQGSMAALGVLSTVLGKEFLTKIAMPCVLSENSDEQDCAKAIGTIFFAARCSGVDVSSLVNRLAQFATHTSSEIRCYAVVSVGVIAKHHNDEHAHEIALNVARNEKDPKVLEELVAVLPDIFGHVIRDEQKKEMLKHGTPCRAGGTTAIPPRLYRRRLSLASDDAEIAHLGIQDSFPEFGTVTVFGQAMRALFEATGPGQSDTTLQKIFDAALAMTICIGRDRWHEVLPLWRFFLGAQALRNTISGGLQHLSRALCPKEFANVNLGGAPESAHHLIEDCLVTCLNLPPEIIQDPSNENAVNLWVWRKFEDMKENNMKILLSNLPFIIAALPPAKRHPEWIYVMQAVYRAFIVSRRVLVEGTEWQYCDDAGSITLDGEAVNIYALERNIDAATLAYQFPAAVAFNMTAKIPWADAFIVHQAISEDDNSQLRWMLARSLHVCPDLFAPEIVPRLAGMMNKLLHDSDLDVAEAVHKGYMDFVVAVAKVNRTVAAVIAAGFFDDWLWNRRIHFEIYRAEQLVVLINLDIVPGGSTQCVNKCIELLNHRCIEVRKQAAGSASEIIMVLGQNTPEAEQLKNVVIGLSEGTCRMKQTFIWAAEQMRNCNMDYFTRHFYAPLKQIESQGSRNKERSVVHNHAWVLLNKVKATAGDNNSPPSIPQRRTFVESGTGGSGRRFTSNIS